MKIAPRWLVLTGALCGASAVALADGGSTPRIHLASASPKPPAMLTARRLRPRFGALKPGTAVSNAAVFGVRVFADSADGFALANGPQAQYPAITTDGGQTWRIDGPQFDVDAADGPEAVGSVGLVNRRTFFSYGSSVVDVSTDAGQTWWETFLGEAVIAVVPGQGHKLIAFVQQSVGGSGASPAITWQFVSRDGGRHWRYSTALGG